MLKINFQNFHRVCLGLSLVELMLCLLLGSLLLVMVIGLYVTSISSGTSNLKISHLRADLQSIMALIETDIRRAGYGGDDYLVGASGTKTIDINTNGNCIVYYYNHNKSTYLEGANKMGFKWEDNSVKFRTGVGTVANEVCDSSYVCPDTVTPDGTTKCSAWTSVSNPNFITITNLSFTENSTSNAVATMRSVDVTLAGELVADSSYKHSITTHVLVRNMEFAY